MTKLIVCYLYEEGKTISPNLSIKSLNNQADKIIIIDGTQKGEKSKLEGGKNIKIIKHPFKHHEKGGNGMQRNVYLDYLKKYHAGDWALVLDCDEIVSETFNKNIILSLEKQFEKENPIFVLSPKMRHTIYNFSYEDATLKEHHVPNRFFKIHKDMFYPETEHATLSIKDSKDKQGFWGAKINDFTIWHIAYSLSMFELRDKYLNHLEKSEIHTPKQLEKWYMGHLEGDYPIKKFDIRDLPKVLKDEFLINDDLIYYRGREGLEVKHFLLAKEWLTHFEPKDVLDVGCGMGHYCFAIKSYGINCQGFDNSKYAITNSPYSKSVNLWIDNITEKKTRPNFDLILVIDVLEHLPYDKIDDALENIKAIGNKFLFLIPFKGNPDLENDKTHIIKEDKEWWINKLNEHKFNIEETPEYFNYKDRIIIAKNERVKI